MENHNAAEKRSIEDATLTENGVADADAKRIKIGDGMCVRLVIKSRR